MKRFLKRTCAVLGAAFTLVIPAFFCSAQATKFVAIPKDKRESDHSNYYIYYCNEKGEETEILRMYSSVSDGDICSVLYIGGIDQSLIKNLVKSNYEDFSKCFTGVVHCIFKESISQMKVKIIEISVGVLFKPLNKLLLKMEFTPSFVGEKHAIYAKTKHEKTEISLPPAGASSSSVPSASLSEASASSSSVPSASLSKCVHQGYEYVSFESLKSSGGLKCCKHKSYKETKSGVIIWDGGGDYVLLDKEFFENGSVYLSEGYFKFSGSVLTEVIEYVGKSEPAIKYFKVSEELSKNSDIELCRKIPSS